MSQLQGVRLEVKNHLEGCPDCKAELLFISEMVEIDNVPDPGDLFWNTLPQKVRASVKEEKADRFSLKALFFRPLPVAATVAALLIVIFIYTKKVSTPEIDPFFKDPLMVSALDYNGIAEKDIPFSTERLEVDELSLSFKNYAGYGYHIDFASLSSKELDGLYEALKKEQKTGG